MLSSDQGEPPLHRRLAKLEQLQHAQRRADRLGTGAAACKISLPFPQKLRIIVLTILVKFYIFARFISFLRRTSLEPVVEEFYILIFADFVLTSPLPPVCFA
jgi:hypothetical protein